MIREEEKDQALERNWKSYSRSMSWTERPPRKTTSKPQWNSKARSCLPPLQPLSITRPNIEEWPRAGSDDLGVWPNPPTPGARRGSVTPRENLTVDQPPREFEFRKDKLAFFNKECSRILDHIYLGSDSIAKDREILRQNGITHVLNCVGFVCPEYFKNELVYKTLWLQDSPSEDITSIFYDVFDYFEDVREQGGRVLVHCCQGVSRSTSLVIAYLMWKEGLSFDDAFEHVKAARGVTNPNVGFACQLLQCQKRVHALPASPTSVIRMYRMAPHSPYDPLHLVPKMLCEPGPDKLDSRGAFVIHVPSALFVWIGKHCSPMMADNAKAAASQVIRYERAQGPAKTFKEGEETSEFWTALSYSRSTDSCQANADKEMHLSAIPEMVPATGHQCLNQRNLAEYDLDFEIFHGALAGGVVPPFPLPETGSEMCLPFRENGWNRLRRKFVSGVVKDFITSSKLNATALEIYDGIEAMGACKVVEDFPASSNLSIPSTGQCDSPDSVSSYVFSSPGWNNNEKEVECPYPPDTNLSRSPSFSLVDSFSSFLVNKPNSKSSSPSLSPSTSDISTSFSFSPSSSNWSDLSFSSPQSSPCGLESRDMDSRKSSLLEDSVGPADYSTHMLDSAISSPQKEMTSAGLTSVTAGLCPAYGGTVFSLVECRGNNVSLRTNWPSTDKAPLIAKNFKDDKMWGSQEKNCSCEFSVKRNGEEPVLVTNDYMADNSILSISHEGRKYNTFHPMSDDVTNKIITDSINPVVYRWPSMDKMDICGLLDSRSVYIIGLPSVCASPKEADFLYVWIGHNVPSPGSYSELIRNDNECQDRDVREEIINCDLLIEKMGFSKNAQIKIVKEGDEPEQLRELVIKQNTARERDRIYSFAEAIMKLQ